MKKIILTLLVCALSAVMLTGCGGADDRDMPNNTAAEGGIVDNNGSDDGIINDNNDTVTGRTGNTGIDNDLDDDFDDDVRNFGNDVKNDLENAGRTITDDAKDVGRAITGNTNNKTTGR